MLRSKQGRRFAVPKPILDENIYQVYRVHLVPEERAIFLGQMPKVYLTITPPPAVLNVQWLVLVHM